MICMSSILVVFSIDFITTRVLGVMGELACFKGLKFRMAFRILLEVWGRERMTMDREFMVASIERASLCGLVVRTCYASIDVPRILVEDR